MAAPTYHVVRLAVPSDEADLLQGKLYDLGCLGLEEIDGETEGAPLIFKTYFDAGIPLSDFLNDLKAKLGEGAAVMDGTTIGLTDASFRPAAFEPFSLVASLCVVPPPELTAGVSKNSPGDIVIMPGLAFGTGRHETTRLVADALWRLQPRPGSVLDVGTGSGILAILAKRLGIPRVDAVEISEEALENAKGNFERNGCTDVGLVRFIHEVKGTYDVLLGNLLTPTILHLKTDLVRLLAPRGRMILSGITVDEVEAVENAFRDFKRLERKDTEDWTCLTLEIS